MTRTVFIAFNGVVFLIIIAVIVVKVLSQRSNPEIKPAENLTPFFDDETLEGRKLERVLGLSLLAVLVIAIALPVYFLLTPRQQAQATKGFDERSVERGAVLFADPTGKAYDSTRSLQCARCHGAQGQGGTAPFVLKPENAACADPKNAQKPECLPVQVSWAAPALQLAGLRYSRDQLTQIITYGRPGTPMPAWGVESGKGVLGTQGIDDLVNYVESLKISPAKAKKQATDLLQADRVNAAKAVTDAEKALSAAAGNGGRDADRCQQGRGLRGTAAAQQLHCLERPGVDGFRRCAAVPIELRPLPHEGLVVLRPAETAGGAIAGTDGWWRVTGPTCATATWCASSRCRGALSCNTSGSQWGFRSISSTAYAGSRPVACRISPTP